MMDAEMLRTILEEQAKQQQAMFTRTVGEIMTSIHQPFFNHRTPVIIVDAERFLSHVGRSPSTSLWSSVVQSFVDHRTFLGDFLV